MTRYAHEFYCQECKYYNYPMLDTGMSGNYTIQCGNCAHHHYRVIKAGVVTEGRHNAELNHGDLIHVMKSASQSKPRKQSSISQLRNLVSSGLAR